MNKYSIIGIALLFAILSACSNRPISSQQSMSVEDLPWVSVIKFTNPTYKDNILATDNSMYKLREHDDSVFYACDIRPTYSRNNFIIRADSIKLLNIPPYIELVDEYMLIDWHWKPLFIHCSDKLNGNYGHTILTELNWTDLKDFEQEWIRTIPNDHEAIDRIHHFNIKALDDYRGDITYAVDCWEKHIMYGGSERQIDSMQNIYAESLKQILRDHEYTEDETYIDQIK